MGSNKETIGGSVEEEMSLDNPSDKIVIAQQQQRKPSVKDKVFAPAQGVFLLSGAIWSAERT